MITKFCFNNNYHFVKNFVCETKGQFERKLILNSIIRLFLRLDYIPFKDTEGHVNIKN